MGIGHLLRRDAGVAGLGTNARTRRQASLAAGYGIEPPFREGSIGSIQRDNAQYAATGCFDGTCYASAREQLDRVLELASRVEPEFVAKTAVNARERAFMKDLPALLLAHLTVRAPELLDRTFPRVVTDASRGPCGLKSRGSGIKDEACPR